MPVSILALPEGRALLCSGAAISGGSGFQSSPFPKEGRYALNQAVPDEDYGFNPRPSRRKGATSSPCAYRACSPLFQSSPFPKEGRYFLALGLFTLTILFQSSPFPKEGRYIGDRQMNEALQEFQSSPFPKEGRYSRRSSICSTSIMFQSSPFPKEGRYAPGSICAAGPGSFNPRPSRRKGATGGAVNLGVLAEVSILALPEGRALLLRFGLPHRLYMVSILALPEGRALPHY